MEVYLRAFINWEQNDWARLLPMDKFIYNHAKNANTGHTFFELNCGYYSQVSFENDVNLCSRSCFASKLAKELKKLMNICQQKLFYAQEFQKRAYDKGLKF